MGCLPFEADPQMVLKTKDYIQSKDALGGGLSLLRAIYRMPLDMRSSAEKYQETLTV